MITYLYYCILEYFKTDNTDIGWQKNRALIATGAIFISNILAVLYFINILFFREFNLLDTILSGNRFIDRFVILPILVLPVFLIVYFRGNKRIDDKIDLYKNEPFEEKRRKKILVIIYIAISFFLITLSMFSPLFIK